VYKRLCSFLEANHIIHEHQFGFRKGRSTTQALHAVAENVIKNIESGKLTLAIFLDLSKAFDTVDHRILLIKLEACGVRGIVLEWFRSYLMDRTQSTEVNGAVSDLQVITCGVPQGSILGPLLFLIYVNGVFSCSNCALTIGFADDTSLQYSEYDIDDLISLANDDLANFADWFNMNRLSLNVKKTKYMVMASRQKLSQLVLSDAGNVKIANVAIERVKEVSSLGIIIDDTLSWKAQIRNVCNKVARGNGMLSRVKGVIPSYLLRTLYFSFVYPVILYGVSVWGAASASKLERIHVLQKKSVRIIANVAFYAHTLSLFKKYDILKIVQVYQYSVCLYTHEIVHGKYSNPTVYRDLINLRAFFENHSHNTRNNEKFILPKCRTDFAKLSISYTAVENWNALPLAIKNQTNCKKFKLLLKDFFISQYER
jgi:ribonuclease P/MRP protein subunit RPP40